MAPFIVTLVTGSQAAKEFQLFFQTIQQWESAAEVFVLTDTPTAKILKTISHPRLRTRIGLDAYVGLTRKDMEARSGHKYPTLFHEYTIEKANGIQWVFDTCGEKAREEGVWCLDADICLLAPLPKELVGPTKRLGLSPHGIRAVDEARYGRYNAGMIWIRDAGLLELWRRATLGSRFYEQMALEAVWDSVGAEERLEFPSQDNFGWWRYLQAAEAPPTIQARFGYNRAFVGCGLTYDGQAVRSIHTHWGETNAFNDWIRGRLEFLARAHPPAKKVLQGIKALLQ